MKKLLLFSLLFLLSFKSYADSNVAISSWQEETMLNETGKTSEILIEGSAVKIPQGRVLEGVFLQFDKSRIITIKNVICDSRHADYSFKDNTISLQFPKEKKNGDKISIYISYNEKYNKVSQFLRQELIDIPPFAAKAKAKVVIRFPGYLESATLNPNIKKIGRGFIYSNVVPEDGVREIIKLTQSENTWDVAIKVKVNSNNTIESATIKTPLYFINGGQGVKNLTTTSNPPSTDQKDYKENRQILNFTQKTNSITIENRATIFTGVNNAITITRSPDRYRGFTPYESSMLTPLLNEMKRNPKYDDLPLYAKIGRFVHDYIEYDLSYVGKLPNIETILKTKIGVCTEYAKLYDAMARVAGIPSLIVNGAACGDEDNQCRGHSWNMIFYNNKWIHVDPTWDLMSGIVSSSHIYFNDNYVDQVKILYMTKKDEGVDSKVDFEMKSANQY